MIRLKKLILLGVFSITLSGCVSETTTPAVTPVVAATPVVATPAVVTYR